MQTENAVNTSVGIPSSGCAPSAFWSGLIDDVRIYNRAVRP